MKNSALFTAVLIACTCSAQRTKPTTYSWQISHGVFTATFPNTPWGTVGSSSDATGTISFSCREQYNEFCMKLYNYGNTTAHIITRGFTGIDDTDVPGLHIILQPSHPYILILDAQGRCWKLTKPEAMALAELLELPVNRDQIPICTPCECGQSRKP